MFRSSHGGAMNTAQNSDKNRSEGPARVRPALLAWFGGTLLVLWVWQGAFHRLAFEPISYSDFERALAAGEVASAAVGEREIEGEIVRKQADGGELRVMYRTARVEDPQ